MWEEGMNTKSQIYYNNNKKHASTPQAQQTRKKGKLDENNVHLSEYFIANDLFCQQQYGFRKKIIY